MLNKNKEILTAKETELEKLNETVKAQAAELRDEYERTKLLLDATPLACRLMKKVEHGRFELFDCNKESAILFGFRDKQEFMERYFETYPEYQPDGKYSIEEGQRLFEKAYTEGRSVSNFHFQIPDGTPIPCEVTLVRVKYGNDFVVAGYTRDLREHNKMMEEIERRDILLSAANQASGMLLRSEMADFTDDLHACMGMLADTVGVDRISIWKNFVENDQLHYYNQVFEWAGGTGFPEDDVTHNSVKEPRCYDLIVPTWEEILSRGECINRRINDMPPYERPHFTKQGIKSVFVSPVFIENQFWGFVGYDNYHQERDFTENEQMIMNSTGIMIANALLRNEMMQKLQFANQAKSDFLAKMSHEMRTPLNAIIGLSALALEDETVNEETRLNIEKVSNAGDILLSTVNDILDLSKIEAGKLELVPVRYDMPSLLNDTVTQSVMHIGEKPIEFILDIDETLPALLFGDDLRIKQLFNNLLSNAFKYTKEGTVELGVRCEREGAETVWMTAWVKDTGVGIKPEKLASLFDEFMQADKHINRHVVGTGLGLSITKKMAELMGGGITVESDYGKGSTFTVRLKQGFVTDAHIGSDVVDNLKSFKYSEHKRRRDAKYVRPKLPYARVLVVDDNVTNLDVARGLMKPYNMKQVDCVTGGQDAIDAVREEKIMYNAILMDHMMPEMDGIEATRRIRDIGTEYAKNIPIIACTANAIAGNEQMFLDNGFQAFISKPLEIGRLDDIIKRWVRGKEQEKHHDEQRDFTEENHANEALRRIFDNAVIPGLDVQSGIDRFDGDAESYLNVLRSYANNIEPSLKKIETVDRDRLSEYTIIVHGIKGSSRSICAEPTGDLAEKLERASEAGDYDFVMKNNEAFVKLTQALSIDILNLISEIDAANQKPHRDRPDKEVLIKLLIACGTYHMDVVYAAVRELERYTYEFDGDLVPWLSENVEQFNIDDVVERVTLYVSENEG
ncbi:MAG: ATP-binding protein [Oscillospiraceae bacterium]|nr:ATP-binding protein [Oscillospiraceae bacterium]